MEYNIDILVAGCNTTCMHCYVNGGKAPIMEIDDFKLCIDKLKPVFENLKRNIGFTLDNEIFNHADALEILEYVEQNCYSNYFFHGSTTGIAFLNHTNQKELLKLLKRNGWTAIGYAIHGTESIHNKIVNSNDGLKAIIESSRIFKKEGFDVYIYLMITKELIKSLPELSEVLSEISYDHIGTVIPLYLPTQRLMKYQSIRCNKDDCDVLYEFLSNMKVDVESLKSKVELYNEETVYKTLTAKSIEVKLSSNNTAYFHIDPKLDFYLGNTGSTLKYLGNIKQMSSEEILNCIVTAKDNYYETSSIHYMDIIAAVNSMKLKLSKENYVYQSEIDAILAMMKNIS